MHEEKTHHGSRSGSARRQGTRQEIFHRATPGLGEVGWLAKGMSSKKEACSAEKERKVMIYKRGKYYWYKFMWDGALVRESTKQGNDKVARQMEAAHRTSLAKGEVGIREPRTVPTLAEFCAGRVEPWAQATFETSCRKNWLWYRTGIRALTSYKALAGN